MIEQRSPEWYQQRKNRLTGSLAGAALGLSPNMTSEACMRLMVRNALGAERETSDFLEDTIMAHGRHYEEGAIAEYEMETGNTAIPCGFFPFEDWSGASPDSLLSDDGLLECKVPWGKRKDEAPVFKTLQEQPHYYAQVQIELLATGRKWADFWQWTPNGFALERVEVDQPWLDDNLPRLRQFHARFLDELRENPEEHLTDKRITIDTPTAQKMVAEYDQLTEALERAGERRRELLAEIVAMSGDRNAVFGGRKLTLTKKAGAVSYAKAVKELAPGADLTKWTGKPSEYWGLK